jgi:protease I
MASRIQGKKVAILAADGFEEAELFEPLKALRDEGAEVQIVSLERGAIEANRHRDKGRSIQVDRILGEARPEDYDALVIPGGVFSPDRLRVERSAQDFTRAFFRSGKPVGAICHGPWVLIDAGVADGRTLTSYPSIRTDLRNAGADVRDEEVVVDEGLVTSRKPADLPAFCAKLIEEIAEGRHQRQADWTEQPGARA